MLLSGYFCLGQILVASVEHSYGVIYSQHAAHLVVNLSFGNAAFLHCSQQRCAKSAVVATGHRHIESCPCCLVGRAGAEPVGHHISLEAPLLLQHVAQQVAVVAHIVIIHTVGRCHHRHHACFYGCLECRQIDFVQCALIHHREVHVAVILAVVAGIVLDARCYALALYATHMCGCYQAVEQRVFGIVFKEASAKRVAQYVAARAEQHSASASTGFFAHHGSGTLHKCWIPCGAKCHTAGKCRGSGLCIRTARSVTARHHRYAKAFKPHKAHVASIAKAHLLFDCHLAD